MTLNRWQCISPLNKHGTLCFVNLMQLSLMNFLLIVFSSYLVGPNQFSFVLPGRKKWFASFVFTAVYFKKFSCPPLSLAFFHSFGTGVANSLTANPSLSPSQKCLPFNPTLATMFMQKGSRWALEANMSKPRVHWTSKSDRYPGSAE